jgi:hypothetical protein
MTVEHVEVLVEEPSMEATLERLLPGMLPEASFAIHAHQGKLDLLGKLPAKLRAYASWLPPTWRIVVVVDRDDDDCEALKQRLEGAVAQAGLTSRARAKVGYVVATRIAIEELEAWFFGDWRAVCAAYPRAPRTVASKVAYRAPDDIQGGTWEALERVLQQAGYFSSGLRKIEAARAIAEHMVPARNTSPSFCRLRDVLDELST